MVQITTINSPSINAMSLATEIFGPGVTVNAASYTGDNRSAGIYTQGDSQAPVVTPADTGVILSTGRATGFDTDGSDPNDVPNTTTNTSGPNNNAQFNALVGASTFDASWLDVDFTPDSDLMTMQFVFSSEEYPEYSNSIYNDAVGVWVNGVPVPLSIGTGDTSVGNVNQSNNFNLFNDNMGDAFQTEMDGFTVTMTLTMPVVANAVNSIRIGIADVGDSSYDSNLLIAGNSVQTSLIAQDDAVRLDTDSSKTFDVLGNDLVGAGLSLTVTHINGQAVSAGSTVTLPNGQSVTLNPDGTFTFDSDSDEEIAPFTYTMTDGTLTDTAFVTVNTIPCFVAGTLIKTPSGERAVETLEPGDLVLTHDNGPQPLRWIGTKTVAAKGDMAPIRIAAHTFGVHRSLLVSPQHRILIQDAVSELLFGESQVLIAAKHLLNDCTVTRQVGGSVRYVHLLFDEHQVVFSEGLPTESFLPGPQVSGNFEADVLEEIATLFPEIDPRTGEGYSPAARRVLKPHEALVLMSQTAPPLPNRLDRSARAA